MPEPSVLLAVPGLFQCLELFVRIGRFRIQLQHLTESLKGGFGFMPVMFGFREHAPRCRIAGIGLKFDPQISNRTIAVPRSQPDGGTLAIEHGLVGLDGDCGRQIILRLLEIMLFQRIMRIADEHLHTAGQSAAAEAFGTFGNLGGLLFIARHGESLFRVQEAIMERFARRTGR